MHGHVAVDSQCYTYLIDAISELQEPSDILSQQRIALFRVFLYRKEGLFITPTVRREFEAIPNPARAEKHEKWTTL